MWWNRKSTIDKVLEFMKEESERQAKMQAAQLKVMEALVQTTGEQAKVVQGYLKLFTDAPKPEIRVMSDVDEMGVEERLKQKRLRDDALMMDKIPVESPDDWMHSMASVLDSYKEEIH